MKLISKEQYNEICKAYHSDIVNEEYDDEQIYDLAICVFDSGDNEAKQIEQYLKSIGIKKFLSRFIDDITIGKSSK